MPFEQGSFVRDGLVKKDSSLLTPLGVARAALRDGLNVARAPAADGVGVEVSHRVGVDAIDVHSVADVDVAWGPVVVRVPPGSVDQAPVQSDTNDLLRLVYAGDHVVRGLLAAVGVVRALLGVVGVPLSAGLHARREAVVVIEGVVLGHMAQAVVHLADIVISIDWVGVESVPVVLARAAKDGYSAEGDSDDTVSVARVASVALRSVRKRPVPCAHLVVEDSNRVDAQR